MRSLDWISAGLCVLSALGALAGCGEENRGPKTELTDDEKQQIIELNQQRADEWGNSTK